jgi:hypothetical protein
MHVVSASVLEGWGLVSDEQVVDRILSGQTALFEVLMRRHNERIYRAARAILGEESEAEDARTHSVSVLPWFVRPALRARFRTASDGCHRLIADVGRMAVRLGASALKVNRG